MQTLSRRYRVVLILLLVITSTPTFAGKAALKKINTIAATETTSCPASGSGAIATIDWVERADWINVKKDVSPAAKGDGITDDTLALQAALNRIGKSPGDPKVVYLPAGTYRITKTIGITEREGGMLIGHGASTRIVWGGRKWARMFWSNGASRQTYLGMVWDGNNKAAVGIDHDSKTLYETRVMHEQMEFRNFLEAGIRVGHQQKLASAEMLYLNLKFQNNKNGVLLQDWNDYNNIFDGCQFVHNGYGIRAEKGNVIVRNSRFEGSLQSDLYLSTHSHSVRRVISSGSNAFIRTVRGPIAGSSIRVQEAIVTGWKSTDGAIVSDLRGPLTLIDVNFSMPPANKPPIRLNNPSYMKQVAITANVVSPKTKSLIDSGLNGVVKNIAVTPHQPQFADNTVFLRNHYPVAEKILDVKVDCGAKGDGLVDDTRMIQKCLALANASVESTVLYFPSGTYRVTDTIDTPAGANFQIEGTGWHSRIVRTDLHEGTALHVHDPDGLRVMHLTVGRMNKGVSLLQTASKAAHVYYHNLYGYHDDELKESWMVFDAMPAGSRIVSQHLDGRLNIRNSSEATVLLGSLISVQTVIEGESPSSGFLGILSRVSALSDYPLVIKDNQSLVQTDWYNEQTSHLVALQGGGERWGQVILDHTEASLTQPMIATLDDYKGLFAQFGGMFGLPLDNRSRRIQVQHGNDIDLVLAGNIYWNQAPVIENVNQSRIHTLANLIQDSSGQMQTAQRVVDARMSKRGESQFNSALEAFRTLGAQDLLLNYCK